ncbi:MAG: MBL fold metallo-hydrolase [Candidatus Hodarchaeota archaeon]
MEITFLGTGGGRVNLVTQKRKTGGIRISDVDLNIHIDPGPGAFIYSDLLGLNPTLDAVLVSHAHIDHSNDAGILIEVMVRFNKTRKRRYGSFIGSRSVVDGSFSHTAVLSSYHRKIVTNLTSLAPNEKTKVKDMEIRATYVEHTDKSAVGFILERDSWKIGMTGDTQYFDELPSYFEKVDCLIVNCLRPKSSERIRGHMNTLDVINLINNLKSKPSLVVLTHLGMRMIQIASKEAKYIENITNVHTIAAEDFLNISKSEDQKKKFFFRKLRIKRPIY